MCSWFTSYSLMGIVLLGSFSLLERRIQTLEEGTTASLARIEQALLLIASKK